jgi:hypothetical protein
MPSTALPAFLLVETELQRSTAFDRSGLQAQQQASSDRSPYVRRPTRGIRLKKETYATIRVDGAGGPQEILNSSIGSSQSTSHNFTSNFILQSVQETRSEKFQSLATFGATYGFFYGEQPRMMMFQALLLNTADFQWEVEWWANYEAALRGTRLADRGARVYLSFDDCLVEGYLTTASTSKSGESYIVSLSFGMWVTNVTYLISPGEKKISERHSTIDSLGMELDDGFSSVSARTAALSGASTTAAVRAANIKAVASAGGTGLLSKLRAGVAAVEGFAGAVGNALESAKDFLYGRNMVIPKGFAASDVYGGQPVFASGSGEEGLAGQNLGGILDGSTLNIRVPGPVTGISAKEASEFADNIDEYPGLGLGLSSRELTEEYSNHFSIKGEDDLLVAMAEATFAGFGYDITNEEGQAASDLARAAGKAAFAALSYAAMVTGASQAAASLTVGNVVGTATANEEQGATEALATETGS